MDRDEAYNIVISDFIKAIEIRKDSADLVSDFEHCIAQIENVQYSRYWKRGNKNESKNFFIKLSF